MKSKENIQELLDYLQTTEEKPVNFNYEAIVEACQKNNETRSLAIKILSVFGGILASLAFIGFLLLAGLYESETGLLFFGIIFIAGAVWISRILDEKIILDTIIVSFFAIGFLLLGLAFVTMEMNENMVCYLFIVMAFLSIVMAQSYLLSFISTLIISGSLLSIIFLNHSYYFIHLYIAAWVVIITYVFLHEAKIITTNKVLSKVYNPVRTGLVLSLLAGLVFVGKKGLLSTLTESDDFIPANYEWISSGVTIFAVIYLLFKLFEILNINNRKHKITICMFTILALLPTVFSPAIPGAVLLLLLSFYVNYKTGLVLGIIAFIYFISQYYYDLNLTLLTKSGLLFSSGVLFIGFYLVTRKKLMITKQDPQRF
ncbi:DUF4401 domain-containing protein [Fluviicola sp.]|jgi:uncharacterized membrane protein|uniref:DUF4401 domain-containing protein n=1 Tax=Fluviicola sp. TaxID=1917219 RepID=UPI00281C7D34|nr:DUF4401 domain-containing protein [Fluviicola sp.]MDR0802452.1 DUF4401 domain-containing protein [Fluviicola sp.]